MISQYQQGLAETRLQSITTCPVVSFLSNTGKKGIRGSDYGSIEVSISVLLEARNQFKASCVKINNHIQSLGARLGRVCYRSEVSCADSTKLIALAN